MRLYLAYGLALPSGTNPKMTTPIIGKAGGGPIRANTPYVVGEDGPEVIVPRSPGFVIPNGAAMNININVAGATMDTVRATSRQQAMIAFGNVLDRLGAS